MVIKKRGIVCVYRLRKLRSAKRFKNVSIFPLYFEQPLRVDYRLGHEAIEDGTVVIRETSASGTVSELVVENHDEKCVLLLEGEELVGAKQNRILNTTVVIAAKTRTTIPVSCVEARRWHYNSRDMMAFRPSGHISPAKLRHALKRSVGASARAGRGHGSNQMEVWDRVAQYLDACHAASETDAMEAAFEALRKQASDLRKAMRYAENATGLAVALGKRVVELQLFDKPDTCRKVWDRLLSGVLLDAVTEASSDEAPNVHEVQRFLEGAVEVEWVQVPAVGLGKEYRLDLPDLQGSALVVDGVLVHGSWVAQ